MMRSIALVGWCLIVTLGPIVGGGANHNAAAAVLAAPSVARPASPDRRQNSGSAAMSGRQPLAKSNYTLLYTFQGTPDGASPLGGLTELNGILYGTTLNGSSNYCSASCQSNDCYLGCGTIFEVSGSGAETVAYNFNGNFNNDADGAWPFDSMTALNGMLYGTTGAGGGTGNHGAVFVWSPSGGERVIYSFKGGTDAAVPEANLVEAGGTLYGTSVIGGGSGCGGSGCGTVFALTPSGNEHVVYSFKGGSDGARVYAPLTPLHGKLYGATLTGGGSGCGGNGCGTIFSIGASGKEHVLYRFGGSTDGAFPNGLTVLNGALYGTTEGGGSRSSGTFFQFSKSGSLATLFNFQDIPDGNLPGAVLIAVKGTLYGTTVGGGTAGDGTVFSITPSGSESVLYSFLGGTDGMDPQAPLVAAKHDLFSTTYHGGGTGCGGSGCGTIFKVKLPRS